MKDLCRAGIFVLVIFGLTAALHNLSHAAEPYKSTADYYTRAFLGGKPYTPAVECGRKCYRGLRTGKKDNPQ